MNYKTIKSTLRTAGLTLAGMVACYLPFAHQANAEGIKEHRIGKAYGLTAEQLMPMMSQDSVRAVVGDNKVAMSTRDFLQSLLEMNVVEVTKEGLYYNLIKNGTKDPKNVVGFTPFTTKGPDGKNTSYACAGHSKVTVLELCGGLGLRGYEHQISDDEALMEIGDRVFPPEVRKERNFGYRLYLDPQEGYVLEKMVTRALNIALRNSEEIK